MRKFTKLAIALCAIMIAQMAVSAQTTGTITGTVVDPNKSLVPGATVVVVNNATRAEFTTVSNSEGFFRVPNVASGLYTATVTGAGFKKTIVTQIKVDVGLTSSITVQMEVGGGTEQVTIVGGGEILRTESATVGTTLTGRQVTDIPTASRDALDLVLALPGTATPGRPRTSTVNGLPKGALNITIDGINVQDNLLRSSDGFFTYIRPRTDAIGEVSTSISSPGAESSGEGAVQIKFVTQNGGNEYRGGAYWYHRDPSLNANYWFSNRDLNPLPGSTKAPQTVMILNQFGGKLGGPISIPGLFSGKDKAFFFVNYEEFRLPERSPLRTRTILSPEAQSGIYRFNAAASYVPAVGSNITCAPSGSAQVCSFNVLARAAALANATMPGTADPTVAGLLTAIRGSLSGLSIVNTGDPNLQQVSFLNLGSQVRKFPTVRFDFNIGKNHHVENIWNYQQFRSSVDFLNGVDPAFPGFPNFGSQDSNRFSNATAWRWNIKDNIVNEARYGILGGTSLFFPQVNPGQFTNQGGYGLNISAAGISNGYITTSTSRRNSPVKQFSDTLNWIKGNHALSFGVNFTQINLWSRAGTAVPTISFGLSSTLEAANYTALVGALPSANQAGAAALWATLAGRVSALNATGRLEEESGNIVFNGVSTQRAMQREYGFFGQDTWKIRPNLTLTLGLRYEVQGSINPNNDVFTFASYDSIWGESGVGNLFKPGTLSGAPTVYNPVKAGTKAWNTDNNNIAPSVGFAWTPNLSKTFLRWIGGNAGQSVFRGGFSRSFVREGTNTFLSILGSNPGSTLGATRTITGSPFSLPLGTLLRSGPIAPPTLPATLTYPYAGNATESVNGFHPDLETGYVDSWSFGYQRELSSDMAIEFRYVGNRGKDLWRQYNINGELSILENGFYDEFKLAQANLAANVAAGRGTNFRYFGAGTGTNPLPIIMAYFTGLAPTAANAQNTANYASSFFANATFYNTLNPLAPAPVTFAATLGGTGNASIFEPTRISAGIPVNFFYVNPSKRGGGAWIIDNSSKTWYDAFTFEFRRRLSKGLLIQSNYTFGKSLANTYASSSVAADQPGSLRAGKDTRRGLSPFDITHSFKTNFIYELPFGRGQSFFGDAPGWVNQIIGGWGFNGNIRIQSGSNFNMGNVQLVGMTAKELQKMIGIYRGQTDAAGNASRDVYILPFEIRQNTYRAFNVGLVSGVPTYTQGAPTGKFIAPAGYGNCAQAYTGQCGYNNLVLKGPAFFRSDISIVKKFRVTERINMEMRGELLNAFNNINFLVGAAANDVNGLGGQGATTFGRYTAAYQDTSTTNDPGGRLVQWVLRVNF